MKYKIRINFETEIEADSVEEASDEFFNMIEKNNETAETWLSDNILIIPEDDKENEIALIGHRG